MFNTLIVQPVFNLLVAILALLPGHNFGLALILFTTIVRLLMWPLIKKQLYHAKAMRELQPQLKRIKQETKGNRQLEAALVMELYKEQQINPFASIGLLIVQLPVLIALYSGINKIVHDPSSLVNFAYPFIQGLEYMKQLAANIDSLDGTLFGLVDLTRAALGGSAGGVYWPAMVIVVAGALVQYFQSAQLMPQQDKGRKLKDILKDAGSGKQADQGEVNAAIGSKMRYFIPVMIFFFTINIASALSLYFLVSGLVAMIQQNKVLGKDKQELTASADATNSKIIEGEVVERPAKTKKSTSKKKRNKKRRRR